MERRTSYRKAIRHDAHVCLQGGAKWPCMIEDFCDKGMYLTYDLTASKAIKASLSLSPAQSFAVQFLGPQGEAYKIPVEVARKIECATGVRFLEKNEQAIESLVKLSLGSKSSQVLINDAKPILDLCVREVMEFSAALLPEVYPQLETALKEEAVTATTDQQANLYMELSQQLKRKQSDISRRYMEALSDPASFLREQYVHHADVSEHLSLIDKGEFEDWLTSRVLITKSESLYREELLPLKIRLDAIGFGGEHFKQSPFGPELFVLAYRSAIHSLVVNNQVERALFKVFEHSFMQGLKPLYEALNALLAKQGVLTDLDVAKHIKPKPRPDSSKAKSSQPKVSEEGLQEVASPESLYPPVDLPLKPYGAPVGAAPLRSAEQQSLKDVRPPFSPPSEAVQGNEAGQFRANQEQAQAAFEKVMGLMRSLKSTSHVGHGPANEIADTPQKYSEDELIEGLAMMQAASADSSYIDDSRSLLERVMGNLGQDSQDQKGIDEDKQVAIDVVDRFFDSLKHNPRLTPDAKQQLNMLEIPVLKVLLKDENFFSENSHSVRQVMNRIAQLGAKGSRLSPSVRARVESLVRDIIENFDQDTKVFDQALEQLDEMAERQSSLYSKNVERVAAAAEGVFRVDQAKIAVINALNKRLGGRPIPKAVQTLIDHGWKDLLNLIHIKHGADSAEWDEHLEIVDTLLSFAENPESRLDMKSVLPKIQEGLKTVSGREKPPEIVREDLKKLIQNAPKSQHEIVTSSVEEFEETEETREARNAQVLKELKPWIRRARAFQVGSWVQLDKSNDDPQFMRLVWVAKGYSKFVFVNHQGMKVVELGLFKFARYLRDQKIKPDPNYEVPIVNQGLDDMIKDVYDKLAYESSHDSDTNLLNYQETCRQIRLIMANGERHSPCGLLFIRVLSRGDKGVNPVDKSVVQGIGKHLLEITGETAVLGRLNDYDFVVFTAEDDMDLLNVRVSEQLALYRDSLEQESFEFEVGEARATIGFINPETLFAQSSRGLTEIERGDDQQEDAKESVLPTEYPLDDNPATDEKVHHHIEEVQSRQSADKTGKSTISTMSFEIFYQRAMGISEQAANDAHCELLCSQRGTGVSFTPELPEDAMALDEWWIERITRRYQEASPDWDSLGAVRVKLSGYALNSDAVVENLLELAESGAVEPKEIWFDIYDSSAIADTHAASDRIEQLIEHGYRFCLDQFGTVRAPFYLMKSLPVHMIKIDEGYVDALNSDDADEGPTDSIVEVAHYLGKNVLATSVDSAICLQRMRKLGIDFVQGSTVADYERLGEV